MIAIKSILILILTYFGPSRRGPNRVSAGTGWPGVSILWPGEMESLICNFYYQCGSTINQLNTYSLWPQSQRSEQGGQSTHGQSCLYGLHPLDGHLPQHVGGHAQQCVHQVVDLTVPQHHVHQLRVVHKVHWQSSVRGKALVQDHNINNYCKVPCKCPLPCKRPPPTRGLKLCKGWCTK